MKRKDYMQSDMQYYAILKNLNLKNSSFVKSFKNEVEDS